MLFNNLLIVIFCHLIGDYVLQSDYLAKSKGENSYSMFVHCMLYCFPFYLAFPLSFRLVVLFVSHFVIDTLKAKYASISLLSDQVFHYVFAFAIYVDPAFQ